MGSPSSGKTSYAMSDVFSNFVRISPEAFDSKEALRETIQIVVEKGRHLVIDACNGTVSQRKFYIDIIQPSGKYQIECHHLKTTMREARDNARVRQKRGGHRLNTAQFIKYRNGLVSPSAEEGFSVVVEIDFVRRAEREFHNIGVFLSLWSICFSKVPKEFPRHPDELEMHSDIDDILLAYFKRGYKFVILANIPEIAERVVTETMAQNCIIEAIKRLSVPVDAFYYSPHALTEAHDTTLPNTKFAILARDKHKIDLGRSTMVGHSEVERCFARQAGFGLYLPRDQFFWSGRNRLTEEEPDGEAKEALKVVEDS